MTFSKCTIMFTASSNTSFLTHHAYLLLDEQYDSNLIIVIVALNLFKKQNKQRKKTFLCSCVLCNTNDKNTSVTGRFHQWSSVLS